MALRATVPALLLLAACRCSAADGYEAGDDDSAGAGFFLGDSSLIVCAAGTRAGAEADDDGAAFQAGLAPLLAALPSAAAAAATGFATLRSGRARAFGLCFFGEPELELAPAAGGCLACLSGAVEAEAEGCGNDTRRAGVWRDGCLLAYADADDGGDSGGFQFLTAGDARPYFDRLDRALADLASAQAEPKGQSLWRKALSVLFYALAAVGAVAIVLLLCVIVGGIVIAETFARHSAAGHAAAGAGQGGEGITAFVAATNRGSPVWSVAAQVRVY